MASLCHTMVFHLEADGISMVDEAGTLKWFCIEETIDHISHGRTLAITKIWDVKEKRPIASTMQDGLIKLDAQFQQSIDGLFAEQITGKAKKSGKL
jgi:acyl-CoA thioesterase